MTRRPIDALFSELANELEQAITQHPLQLDAIDQLAAASGLTQAAILQRLHAKSAMRVMPQPTGQDYYRNVPLPEGLTVSALKEALDYTQELMAVLNFEIRELTGLPLSKLIQRNNYSGVVSNLLTVAMDARTVYKRNSDLEHPDLKADFGEGIEIKATVDPAKGGESHNALGGWHLIASYSLDEETGQIRFSVVKIAELVSLRNSKAEGLEPDWKYMRSGAGRVAAVEGETEADSAPVKETQRTETFVTTAQGTWKLRHGTVYLDPDFWRGWERQRYSGEVPSHSPWFALAQARATRTTNERRRTVAPKLLEP